MARRLTAAKRFEHAAADFSKLISGTQPGTTKFLPGYSTRPVRKAFNLTGLDPDSPRDWQFLAAILAQSMYGSPEGRPKFWGLPNLKKLGEMTKLIFHLFPDATEQEVCELIRKRWNLLQGPGLYHPPEVKTLMRKLQEAKKKVPNLKSALAVARADGLRVKSTSGKKAIAR